MIKMKYKKKHLKELTFGMVSVVVCVVGGIVVSGVEGVVATTVVATVVEDASNVDAASIMANNFWFSLLQYDNSSVTSDFSTANAIVATKNENNAIDKNVINLFCRTKSIHRITK